MNNWDDYLAEPGQFSGIARLFPLPNLVLFPTVLQPLRVFERRYIEMVTDAVAGDRLIGMALLKPGYETDYEDRPAIHGVCCLGRITTHQTLKNGHVHLLLQGVHRARVIRELPADKSYREAEVELLEDLYPEAGAARRPSLRARLIQEFQSLLPSLGDGDARLHELLANELSLGALADVVAYTIDFDLLFKLRILAEANVDARAAQLIDQLIVLRTCIPDDECRPPSDVTRN